MSDPRTEVWGSFIYGWYVIRRLRNNGLLTRSDVDTLRERAAISGRKIAALKEKLEGCKQQYDVYQDILDTYKRLSKRDYVEELVEEEKRQAQIRKKKQRR